MTERPRILLAVTDAISAEFLMVGALAELQQQGFNVGLAAAPGAALERVAVREGVRVFPVPLRREIRPGDDLRALRALVRVVREFRPHIVSAGTPKAGLLGMLAARWAGSPVRVYLLRGLRLETTRGLKRLILRICERLACRCAGRVVCVSPSLRGMLVQQRLCPPDKAIVLGAGSSNGVDLARFASSAERIARAQQFRRDQRIPAEAPLLGFVGRLTRDKGLPDLLAAFEAVAAQHSDVHLLVVGGREPGDPPPDHVLSQLAIHPRIRMVGALPDPAVCYAAMDILVFPSHREGLPNVPLEAAAAERPVVAYAATGTVDAVRHGASGLLAPVGDRGALAAAIVRYLADPELRRRHGRQARAFAETHFARDDVWRRWREFYTEELTRRGLPRPIAQVQRLSSSSSNELPRANLSETGIGAAPAAMPRPAMNSAPRLPKPAGFYLRIGKRTLDILGALLALVLLAPLLLIVAPLVRLRLGSPALFTQQRPGRDGRPFLMRKFRTMTSARDPDGRLLPDDQRLTTFGRWLRSTSLDELPELWSVLRGDMSLVGPRPLLPEYLPLYSDEQRRRHEVRPGLTGWAQVHGRNQTTWQERLQQDVWYVDHCSLGLDLKILWLTVRQVLSRKGVSAEGHATMPPFEGAKSPNRDAAPGEIQGRRAA